MKFVIIGCGQFGRALAINLTSLGYEVTVLDSQEAPINAIKDSVAYALIGDATDPRVLGKLELVSDDTYVIVAVGENYERNLMITAQLREMGVKNLLARSVNELQTKMLKLIGVTEIFRVEDVAARQLTQRFTADGLVRLRKLDETHSLADIPLPAEWVGKKLSEVGLRADYRLNLLTVRRGKAKEDATTDDVFAEPEQPVIDTPEAGMQFREGDVLVLFGKDSDLRKFAAKFKL